MAKYWNTDEEAISKKAKCNPVLDRNIFGI